MIAVSINTWQGSYVQAEEMVKSLQNYSQKFSCPVYTFAEDAAIGPGYVLLTAGHKVFADNFSLVGGVAATLNNLDLVDFGKQQGIKFNIESVGKFKVRNHPFLELSSENKAWVQKLLETRISLVRSILLERRGNKIPRDKNSEDQALGGETFYIENALKLGLVDAVKGFRDIIDKHYDDCKITEIKVKDQERQNFQSRLESLALEINEKMISERLTAPGLRLD
jgi:ClpP class serine protease